MTKNAIYWLLWIALAAISVWVVYSSSTFRDCLIEKNSGIENIVSYRFRSVECSGRFLTQFANQIIALFTIVIGVGTVRLVTTARDTAQRQLRAYVGVSKPAIRDNKFNIEAENGGQTPAYRVQAWFNTHNSAQSKVLPEGFVFGDQPNKDMGLGTIAALHPNKQFVFAFDLKPEEVKKAQRNDTNLFLYGRVQYEDIFKKKHETTFCFGYHQSKKGKTKINHFPMRAMHNDAT